MPDVVVDTNVLSFVLRRSRDEERYAQHLRANVLHVSFMTLAELDHWVLQANWGTERRFRFEAFIARLVVHPSSRELGQLWAQINVQMRRLGRPIGVADAWIAATALHSNLPLVTDNLSDFEGIPGLRMIHEPSSGLTVDM